MTYQLCAILDAWPTSSQLPGEIILLDYKLNPFMAIVFCTNRFLETARLIFEECQRSSQVPWCWLGVHLSCSTPIFKVGWVA